MACTSNNQCIGLFSSNKLASPENSQCLKGVCQYKCSCDITSTTPVCNGVSYNKRKIVNQCGACKIDI